MFGLSMMNENEIGLARLIIDTLNLDFDIETADADTPLYGDGFGLDSIDILEVALAVSQRYGVKLRSDDENNVEIFKSLRALSNYIQANKIK
ncbi:MAG TPA: phosphopantetheine-binding protein [Aliidongia sp.]|nr:phosphopantetheine-binding protein [Aliidongia sp.]